MERANDTNDNKIPENDPSKAMDSKREVEQSPDNKTDQDFPGYPHYPAKEDIMDKRTDSHRVDVNVEDISNTRNVTGVSQRFGSERDKGQEQQPNQSTDPSDDFSDIGPRTEISNEGLETLGSRNAEIGIPQNADNDDLNKRMPGTDLDDEDTSFESGNDADVTPEERMALENVGMPTDDENNLRRAALDNTDFDGDELNEDSFGEVLSSADLDIPEENDETDSTSLGQGDEENKYYSLGGDRQDRNEEDPYSGPNRGNDA
jgi:hypothetical protein